MKTEDLTFNDSGEWQVIEQFSECLPHIGISVLSQALVIESVPKIEIMKKIDVSYTCVICLDSWLPLRIVSLSLKRTFKHTSKVTVSTE